MAALTIILLLLFAPFTWANSVFPDEGRIIMSLETEPPNLDSSLSSDTTSARILRMTNEGLVRNDRRGRIIPAVAESWDQTPTSITFYLREDAKWSNGDPVSAHDFVYAARRLVDPATGATGSQFLVETFKNAEAIIAGKMPPESMGFRAIDDRTLLVELSRPAPFAIYLLNDTSFFPLQQSFVEAQGDKYAANPDHLMANGPFIIEKWVHGASLEVKKNPQYWNADAVKLEEVDFNYITSDVRARFNLFKSDQLAALELDEQVLKDAVQTDHRIQKAPQNCLMYIDLNQAADRPLNNLNLRKAIRLGLDRDSFVNNIVGMPGVVPLASIYTTAMTLGEGRFIRQYPVPQLGYDPEEARRLVALAKEELGVDEIPPIVLLTREQRALHAEFIQSQLNTTLGLNVRVDIQTFKQYLVKLNDSEYDLTSSGFCVGSFRDPIVLANLFESNSPFNRNGFSSKRYDELIQLTHTTVDPKVRGEAFDEIQQIVFDQVVVIPTHQLSTVFVQHPQLAGIRRYPTMYFADGYLR
jgi:oligopeptide transport system substrate-binding protein